jgi:hypothetical protein
MKTIEYFVKEEDIRNPQKGEEVVSSFFKGKDATEHVFVVDYLNVMDPKVTMSTGLIFQNFVKKGVAKVIIRNHRHRDILIENPVIKMLIRQNKLEVK